MPEFFHRYETPAPRYTETDKNGLSARLRIFENNYPDYPIVPVTKHPDTPGPSQTPYQSISSSSGPWQSARDDVAHALQADIVTALFASISSKDTAAVTHLITQDLISPDCPRPNGETPLLASIRSRSVPTARALLALGADPNLTGRSRGPDHHLHHGGICAAAAAAELGHEDRTPLMLAAATGQLAMVRVLVEEFGADDGAVGPRGGTALRLAADAGHADVVRYLPARRGGAWRRVRHSREVAALRRAVAAAGKVARFLGWDVPRLTLVDIPWEGLKWAWRRRHRAGSWVVRVVRSAPAVLRDLADFLWEVVNLVPRLARRAVVWVSEALPRAWGIVWKGLADGLRRVGRAAAFAARRLASALHTFFAAVGTRLKHIKLRDVEHDLMVAMEALFVKLPGAVWAFMTQSVAVAGRAFKACFSSSCVRKMFKLLCIVPHIMWSLLESLWASFGRGLDELITLINPKRVSSRASRS